MKAGAVLFGIAVVGVLLGGGVGPCGPASVGGLIAFLSFGAAWIVSIVSLAGALGHPKSRSMLGIPVAVATALTASFALVMKQVAGAGSWTDAGSIVLCLWPPAVATVHTVRGRILQAA